MELWVRSKNRLNLLVITSLKIERTTIYGNNRRDEWYVELGAYKTKERALEVLDEIQRYLRFSKNAEINNKDFLRYLNEVCEREKCNEILNNISVYEMPQE